MSRHLTEKEQSDYDCGFFQRATRQACVDCEGLHARALRQMEERAVIAEMRIEELEAEQKPCTERARLAVAGVLAELRRKYHHAEHGGTVSAANLSTPLIAGLERAMEELG